MLDAASIQPSQFRTRNWVKIYDESRVTYTSNDVKFKTTMLRSNLCDYVDAYILVNEGYQLLELEMIAVQDEQMKERRV